MVLETCCEDDEKLKDIIGPVIEKVFLHLIKAVHNNVVEIDGTHSLDLTVEYTDEIKIPISERWVWSVIYKAVCGVDNTDMLPADKQLHVIKLLKT